MRKVLVTIVGRDRPGIVHKVGQVLTDHKCNIVEVSQTTLLGEFAGLFSTSMPLDATVDSLSEELSRTLDGTGLAFWIKDFSPGEQPVQADVEPYVITLRGPDRLGIIPEFAGVVAGFEVNIDNLRAVSLSDATTSNPGAPVVLVFDREERLAEFSGGIAPYAALPGRVVAAMQRQAPEGDFRANLHRGGSASAVSSIRSWPWSIRACRNCANTSCTRRGPAFQNSSRSVFSVVPGVFIMRCMLIASSLVIRAKKPWPIARSCSCSGPSGGLANRSSGKASRHLAAMASANKVSLSPKWL